MTERPVTKVELLVLSLSIGLFCGLAVLNSSSTGSEQDEDSGQSNAKELLSPGPELRAPLRDKWYGLPGNRSAAFPESETEEGRLK